MGYIYKITNKINNKVYIGQTSKTIEERFQRHLSLARQKVNRYLYDAINYYGKDNFEISQIEECSEEQLDNREKYWIKHYQSNNKEFGYNMTEGGEGGNTWKNNPHKKETILKSKQTKIKNGTYGKGALKGTPSPNKEKYIIIQDKKEFLQDLQKGLTNEELIRKYNCGRGTIFKRCKDWFNQTPDEIRGIKLTEEQKKIQKQKSLEELSDKRSKKWLKENNPNYKEIDYLLLEKLLFENKTLEEISIIFNVSKPTLINKIKNKYNMNTRELRKNVKSRN